MKRASSFPCPLYRSLGRTCGYVYKNAPCVYTQPGLGKLTMPAKRERNMPVTLSAPSTGAVFVIPSKGEIATEKVPRFYKSHTTSRTHERLCLPPSPMSRTNGMVLLVMRLRGARTSTISRSTALAVWLETVPSERTSSKPPSLSAGNSLSDTPW